MGKGTDESGTEAGTDGGSGDTQRKVHDAMCKKTLEDPHRAANFLHDYVPQLRGRIESVRLASETLTDSQTLRELQCDCVIEVTLKSGERNLVFVVVEHKSTPDAMAILQVAKYIIGILERYASGDAKKLREPPSIIPVLLYHGKAQWTMPECLDVTLGEGADAPGLRLRCIPVNLSEIPEDALSSNESVQSAFFTMRYVCEALKGKNRLYDVVRALPEDLHFAKAIVEYLIRAGKDSADAIESALNEVKPETGGIIMANAAQELIARGKAEALTRLMERRFNGDLTPELQRQIAGASNEELDVWFDRGIDAPSVEAVFGGKTKH